MTLAEVKVASAALNDAIQALDLSAPIATPVTVTEIDIKESDGSEVVATPAAAEPAA